MSDYYELPGGLVWVKQNLKTIIGNTDLAEIMQFGDTWRDRGHKPMVHVVSPAMDGGKMWDQHTDPSGLLDNIATHIDMFIVDFNNINEPELPKLWEQTAPSPQWLLWEYKSGKVRFNGPTKNTFMSKFGLDPTTGVTPPAGDGGTTDPGDTTTPGTITFPSEIKIHHYIHFMPPGE